MPKSTTQPELDGLADAWATEPDPDERCLCGRPAKFVLTNALGSTPWCGSGREVIELLPSMKSGQPSANLAEGRTS